MSCRARLRKRRWRNRRRAAQGQRTRLVPTGGSLYDGPHDLILRNPGRVGRRRHGRDLQSPRPTAESSGGVEGAARRARWGIPNGGRSRPAVNAPYRAGRMEAGGMSRSGWERFGAFRTVSQCEPVAPLRADGSPGMVGPLPLSSTIDAAARGAWMRGIVFNGVGVKCCCDSPPRQVAPVARRAWHRSHAGRTARPRGPRWLIPGKIDECMVESWETQNEGGPVRSTRRVSRFAYA